MGALDLFFSVTKHAKASRRKNFAKKVKQTFNLRPIFGFQVYMCDSCEKTEFGCCIDLENAALGPNFEGCPDEDGSGGYVDCTLTVSVSL